MIPLWKLRRELYRGYEHLWSLVGLVYEPVLKARHDAWRRRQPVPQDEAVALTDKVAVVLIYQPKGIAPSLLVTLRHFVDQGYAPLIVSNAPLDTAARASLAPTVWRIFERPNFGYDFGGYRDGVLLLRQWRIAPRRLIIMNDSVWLPLQPGSTLIARLEAAAGDIVGGFKHPESRRKRFRTVRSGFLESYLYLVNRSAWEARAFQDYWQGYRASSNKLNAIYRGERGFSRRMAAAGLTVTGLFTPDGLLQALRDAPDRVLQDSLRYAAYTEDDLASEGAALLQARPSAAWRAQVLDHVERTSRRRRFNASFPYPSVALLQMDFLKKSAGPKGAGQASLHYLMRRKYLDAVQAGHLPPPHPEVLSEIEARLALDGTERQRL